jgi:agmatinase
MPHSFTSPNTFAGFPAYDPADSADIQIAVIGVPYLSPYPVEKSYNSQNAAAAIRQASLTYQKVNHFDFDFGGRLLGDPPVCCVDCGDIIRETASFRAYSQSITRAIRELLSRGIVPVVIGGDHGTTIPVLRALLGMDFVEVVPERDLANLTSLFAARQILNFMGVAAHSGQFSQRRSVPPA